MQRRQLLQGVIAGAALGVAAQPARAARGDALRWLEGWLGTLFDWQEETSGPDGVKALRERALSLAEAHRKRLAATLPAWVDAAAAGLVDGDAQVEWRLWNRVIDEMARHQVDRVSPAVDEAWVAALQQPQVCRLPGARHGWWALHLMPLAGLDAARRDLALEGEAQLLARWGQPRPELPARPARTSTQQIEALVAAWNRGGPREGLAMPQVAAAEVFVNEDREPAAWGTVASCSLHRWWLQRELARPGADRRALIDQWRFGVAAGPLRFLDRQRWLPRRDADASAYPPRARRFEVTGDVVVRVLVDREGRAQRADIVERRLAVPGVIGRPVAFEDLLDEGSLARVMAMKHPAPDAALLKDGVAPRLLTLAWKLE